jgi:hypothetical protein
MIPTDSISTKASDGFALPIFYEVQVAMVTLSFVKIIRLDLLALLSIVSFIGLCHSQIPKQCSIPQNNDTSLRWTHTLETTRETNHVASIMDITSTGDGKVAVCGYAYGSLVGSLSHSISMRPSESDTNVFLMDLDASGDVLWTNQIGLLKPQYLLSEDALMKIGSDTVGNVYVAGWFDTRADFDSSGNEYWVSAGIHGSVSPYLLKLNAQGEFVWVITMKAEEHGLPGSIKLAVSPNGDSTFLYQPTSDSVLIQSSLGWAETQDCPGEYCMMRVNMEGQLVWVKAWDVHGAVLTDIECDNEGDIYITGSFLETYDFDPGSAVVSVTPIGVSNGFVMKIADDAGFGWVRTWGNAETRGDAIAVSEEGDVYVTGYNSHCSPAQARRMEREFVKCPYLAELRCYDNTGSLLWSRTWGEYNSLTRTELIWRNRQLYNYGSYEGIEGVGPDYSLAIDPKKDYGRNFHLWIFDEDGQTVEARTWIPADGIYLTKGIDVSSAGDISLSGAGELKSELVCLSLDKLLNEQE